MTQNDLLHRTYLEMVSRSDRDNQCTVCFGNLARSLGTEKNDTIVLVNRLIELDKIKFLGAIETIGDGDYLVRYSVRKW